MLTTVTSTEKRATKRKGNGLDGNGHRSNGYRGGGGRGSGGGDGGGGGGGNRDDDAGYSASKRHRAGLWVALASILMLFGALAGAYVVLAGSSKDWLPVATPHFIWLSTAFILLSSAAFEAARRQLERNNDQGYQRWLLLTVALGTAFLVSQVLAWRELAAQGLYSTVNAYRAFFYILTGTHGVHLFGGLLGLFYLLVRAYRAPMDVQTEEGRATTVSIVALYWHFMDVLWVGLLMLLLLWK